MSDRQDNAIVKINELANQILELTRNDLMYQNKDLYNSLEKIDNLIDTTESLIELSQKYSIPISKSKIKIIGQDVFFQNCLLRTRDLLNSIKTLSPNFTTNKIAIFIVLRPLILDSMLYYYLFKLVENINTKDRDNILQDIINDCMKEGVKRQYHCIINELKSYQDISEKERALYINNFIADYQYAIKDYSNINKIEFINPNFEITAKSISNGFKDINPNDQFYIELKTIYEILSKYDHNTIVSIKNHFNKDFDIMLFERSIKKINHCFLYFIKIILNGKVNNKDYFEEIFIVHDKYKNQL